MFRAFAAVACVEQLLDIRFNVNGRLVLRSKRDLRWLEGGGSTAASI